jgi:hypothetical protein
MIKFVLAFPYKGGQPGDVIAVEAGDVAALVASGTGHPEGSQLVLKPGKLPGLAYPGPAPETPSEADTEAPQAAPKRRSKAADKTTE